MRSVLLTACALIFVVTVTSAQRQGGPPGAGRGQDTGAAVTPPPAGARAGGGRAATAPPPITWASPTLAEGQLMIDSALVRPIKITVTKGFNQPWSMVFVQDASGSPVILVTERSGKLRLVRNGVLDPTPLAGLPTDIQASGLAGLMDIQLHPKFAENKLVYLTYHKRPAGAAAPAAPAPGQGRGGGGGGAGVITLARARWDGTKLVDLKDLFSSVANGNASRIMFMRDGTLIMSVGYGDPPQANNGNPNPETMPPQDPMDLAGKTLRLKDDGTVPPDNPFVGKTGYRPEIYTMGHRNILGLAMNPATGAIWSVENGPNGGDEVNELQPGKNYGWPVIGNGRFYLGSRVSADPYRANMEPPVAYWVPAIAPSGLLFYTGDKFPEWKNNLFVGSMRQGEVPRSGHLERFDFNDKWEELHREGMLRDLAQRIRDVRQGPDGSIYLLTAEGDGAMLHIEPGK